MAAAAQGVQDATVSCWYTWIVLGLLAACLYWCISIVCGANPQFEERIHWSSAARSRRAKRRWIRSGKGRLTPGPRIGTKQLNLLQEKGNGVLPMHARAMAIQPDVDYDYTKKATWGYKVSNALLKIVCICKYYTSGRENTVVQPACRHADTYTNDDSAERHSH